MTNESTDGHVAPSVTEAAAPQVTASQADELVAALRRLERFAAEESARVSHSVVPKLEAHARENLWMSLLLALGLGVIVGLYLAGGRRRG